MANNSDISAAASKVGQVAAVGTAGGSFLGFLNEYAVVIGLIIAFGGFLVNWYYKHKEYKLHERVEKTDGQN